MRTPDAEAALADWVAYRRESRKPVRTARTLSALLAKPEWSADPGRFVAAVRHSIAQGYQGCFAPSEANTTPGNSTQAYLAKLEAGAAAERARQGEP